MKSRIHTKPGPKVSLQSIALERVGQYDIHNMAVVLILWLNGVYSDISVILCLFRFKYDLLLFEP